MSDSSTDSSVSVFIQARMVGVMPSSAGDEAAASMNLHHQLARCVSLTTTSSVVGSSSLLLLKRAFTRAGPLRQPNENQRRARLQLAT